MYTHVYTYQHISMYLINISNKSFWLYAYIHMLSSMIYPLVNSHATMENHHAIDGTIQYFDRHSQ